MPLIAITREMGACGTEIAAKVANALNVPLVHHEIADIVASRWALKREAVLAYDAVRPPSIKGFHSRAERNMAYINSAILFVAARHSAVFRGWGAAQLLYKVPHALRVHVGASFKVRLARMRERISLETRLVRQLVEKDDAIRARLAREYWRIDWRDPNGYDLVINTGRSSVDDAVEEIVALARCAAFRETPQARKALENLRREAHARAALYSNPATRDLRLHVKACGEEIEVGGIVDNGDQREEVIRTLQWSEPGTTVTSRLRAPTDYRTRASSI